MLASAVGIAPETSSLSRCAKKACCIFHPLVCIHILILRESKLESYRLGTVKYSVCDNIFTAGFGILLLVICIPLCNSRAAAMHFIT